jgi:branched-chain amino acid transport system substrate-binding protein
MSKKNGRLYILFSILSLFALASSSCSERNSERQLHLGAILSLTGPAAAYGQDNLRGVKLAQKVVNSGGGINGKMLDVKVEDSSGDPAQAVTLAQRFAADREIAAILGPTRTGSTVAVAKLLPNLKISMMSVGSTGDWPTAEGKFNEWTFRSTRVDSYLIEPLLKVARDRYGIKTLAIVYTSNDDWSMSVLKIYRSMASKLGINMVSEQSQMTGDTDRSAQLTEIMKKNPDALIINTLASDAPLIAGQARTMGFKGRFIGTAGFTNPQTWNLAGSGVLDGTVLADNFFAGSSRPAVRKFVEEYRKEYKVAPPAYAAYAYDGLMLVAEAARKVKDPLDRKALRDALGSIQDYEGVLGKLSYQGSGDAKKEPLVLEIRGNGYTLVQQGN